MQPSKESAQPEAYPVATSNQKRVAVVGSGIAGLTAAYLLSRKHHVTLFEREELLGMDAHSRDAYGARMDIPLRVFSESYYPNLCRLYQLLGIRYHPADYSFSCAHGAADGTAVGGRRAYFRYTNLLLRGMAIPLPSVGLLLSPHRLIKYLGAEGCKRLVVAASSRHPVGEWGRTTSKEYSLSASLQGLGRSFVAMKVMKVNIAKVHRRAPMNIIYDTS